MNLKINLWLAWTVIGIVVLQVILNLAYIFPYKIWETWKNFEEKRRIDRLKFISKIEQKYLYFDYKSFFLSTLNLYDRKLPKTPFKKQKQPLPRPTEVYEPENESSSDETPREIVKFSPKKQVYEIPRP